MNKRLTAFLSLAVIIAFIVYIILDSTNEQRSKKDTGSARDTVYNESWVIEKTLRINAGKVTSVAVSGSGSVFIGGDSFVQSLGNDLKIQWTLRTDSAVTSLAVSGDTIFASGRKTIMLVTTSGKLLAEWGPYEDNSEITSVAANKSLVAFADAGTRRVYVLNMDGEVKAMMGQAEDKFVIPSPYFDVAFSGSYLMIANTGNHAVETWTTDGRKVSSFGEPGTSPERFCGCCNPAHFTVIPQGFITAEKGLNRIKILNKQGGFVEFVSVRNNFVPSVPLDIASKDGKTIYAVNSGDSNLYIYKRK